MAKTVRLHDLAYARSGDKGASATLAVFARSPEHFEFLEEALTSATIKAYFAPMGCSEVKRCVMPKIHALNFVLKDVLGEGGSRSLRVDAQGKAIGQAALAMELDAPGS